jgi:hypothetical protein
MWRDEVNEAGGIKAGDKNYKVRFVTNDDQSLRWLRFFGQWDKLRADRSKEA